jgi:hypothetical protein
MTNVAWLVEGVHMGKKMSDLPITYLLWFVASHQMRRTRWSQCQRALCEISRRLTSDVNRVEADLIADLQPRSFQEREAMKSRSKAYLEKKTKSK